MLEIIAETLQDALAAELGGATQIDLKANFLEDGVTPTAGMVECVCKNVNIDVIVMIRPRVDNKMVLNPEDIEIMCHDIRLSRERGASGFLLGALTDKNEIDFEAIKIFQEAAVDKPIHFHLAWELADNHEAAILQLIDLGVKSIRTTGGQALTGKVENSTDKVHFFNEIAMGKIDLLLAGGVNPDNITELVTKTGVTNAHSGVGVRIPASRKGDVDVGKVVKLKKGLEIGIAKLKSKG